MKSNVTEKTRSLKNVSMTITSGSRRKQRLSNSLSITRTLDGGVITTQFSIREAKAIQKFLNETLD